MDGYMAEKELEVLVVLEEYIEVQVLQDYIAVQVLVDHTEDEMVIVVLWELFNIF